MKAIDAKTMSTLEKEYMNVNHISSEDLMFTAGIGVAKEILSYLQKFIYKNHIKRVVFLVGKGNNGGDGCVAAQYLSEETTLPIVIYHICDMKNMTRETAFYFSKLSPKIEVKQKELLSSDDFTYGDILVDTLLGTGFSGELKDSYKNWIEKANDSNNPIIAIDVPSGLNASTGEVTSVAIKADITLTIGLPKKGFFINEGLAYIGKLVIVDIGIFDSKEVQKETDYFDVFTSNDARKYLRRIENNIHKRTMGSVLVIGGCKYYAGAAFLAGKAALRSGAGLVTTAIPASLNSQGSIKSDSVSLIVQGIKDSNSGYFTQESIPEIEQLAKKHNVIVLGPGFGTYPDSKFLIEYILSLGKRTVIDADALNLISHSPEIITKNTDYVYTPHQGELVRLLKTFDLEESYDRIQNTKSLIKNIGGTIILKGNKSLIVSDRMTFNTSGSASLATAGTGDVLSGIIGSMLCDSKLTPHEAASLAVFIHGLAGELVEEKIGIRGAIAEDIIESIPTSMKNISVFA